MKGYDFEKINEWLEFGFQRCLTHTLERQETVEASLHGQTAFKSLSNDRIVKELGELSSEIYKILGETLFRLIPLFHRDQCPPGRAINLYFWPGYHSYLTNKRIFVRQRIEETGTDWNFGIGIWGDPTAEDLNNYNDSCQARWYHYLVGPRNRSAIKPGDVHKWLLLQRPKYDSEPDGFQKSLTISTAKNREQYSPDHSFLSLSQDRYSSEGWGQLFSDAVNHMGVTENPDWMFPDSRSGVNHSKADREACSKLTSVWLHTAFCDQQPVWLNSFIQELLERENSRMVAESLRTALCDNVAVDWGDAIQHRPLFTSWSYLSLFPWPAPGLPPRFDLISRAAGRPELTLANQTLGSAEILASITLSPTYLGLIRRWISTIYGMIRGSEISILLHNYRVEVESAAMLAGPYFAQELKELVDGGLSRVLREASDNSEEAINNRLFVLRSARALGSLAYNIITAVLSRDEEGLNRETEDFLKGLSTLHENGMLVDGLQQVAAQVYECVRRDEGGRIEFPPNTSGADGGKLNQRQLRSCFLLVAEMIRSHCESEPSDSTAYWNASTDGKSLNIQLTGKTIAQRNPTSMSFARLDMFLHALGIGQASVSWTKQSGEQSGECTYSVVIASLSGSKRVTKSASPQINPTISAR